MSFWRLWRSREEIEADERVQRAPAVYRELYDQNIDQGMQPIVAHALASHSIFTASRGDPAMGRIMAALPPPPRNP